MALQLFPRDHVVGIFRGFQQGGLEFHADLVLPYQSRFQSIPMHGQFVLVQLETPNEAVLGRIASFSSDGKLAYGTGEEFNLRAVREEREIPEDLREQYLKYKVSIRVLGVVRVSGERFDFVPSHRRLPHVGSRVAFPSPEVLREIAGHNIEGAAIGHLAFGEYVYAGGSDGFSAEPWMQVLTPDVTVRFPVESLVSRRSFIFARAGFGKSNLNKLLFAKLYETTPTITKRGGREVPVGTVLFDPDGEYFWPDDKGRPGLCDVPALEDKLVVFTDRRGPSPFYQSFVAGGIKLDIRRLRPADVIAIALDPERQEQQNVRKLRGLNPDRWERLVDAVDVNGHGTPLEEVAELLDLELPRQEAETTAARSNIVTIVKMLHDKTSQLLDKLLFSLKQGKLCVIDVSQMRGGQSLILSGLILRRIFDRNQQQFTEAEPDTIPTIAVVEEAQSVLTGRDGASAPYIEWVKEGRKYDLGALLITQQPGSIPVEILSQGDNWFIFHLLSSADLIALKRANSHFSDDLLSSLLNEPIPGHGVFWSSVGGKPYPISLRAESFEVRFSPRDATYSAPAARTFARLIPGLMRGAATDEVADARPASGQTSAVVGEERRSGEVGPDPDAFSGAEAVDEFSAIRDRAIEAFRQDRDLHARLRTEQGVAWGWLKAYFRDLLPPTLDDLSTVAYQLVSRACDEVFGRGNWETHKVARGDRQVTYIRLKA
jgi:DNA helicase HerA-like ATPase